MKYLLLAIMFYSCSIKKQETIQISPIIKPNVIEIIDNDKHTEQEIAWFKRYVFIQNISHSKLQEIHGVVNFLGKEYDVTNSDKHSVGNYSLIVGDSVMRDLVLVKTIYVNLKDTVISIKPVSFQDFKQQYND